MANHTQVAVIGGGLVGKATAVAAANAGFSTLHVAPDAPVDRRTSALMGPSVDYMIDAGLIDDPETLGTPLTRIRIIDATGRLLRAPETVFSASEFGHRAFGWNFANARLGESFSQAAAGNENLDRRAATLKSASRVDGVWHLELGDGGTLTAELLVGADGKGSSVRKAAGIAMRERKFDQAALVCDLELERGLDGESGLRDVANLNACLKAANPGSYGWADAVARSYGGARRGDLTRTGAFVGGLFTSLLSPHLPAQALRSVGLWGLKTIPLLRKQAISFGMGQ